jgi:hypothetical protein
MRACLDLDLDRGGSELELYYKSLHRGRGRGERFDLCPVSVRAEHITYQGPSRTRSLSDSRLAASSFK